MGSPTYVRPNSLLTLLRLLDSRFREIPYGQMKNPPLDIKILLESNPLKSRILVYGDWPYARAPRKAHLCALLRRARDERGGLREHELLHGGPHMFQAG